MAAVVGWAEIVGGGGGLRKLGTLSGLGNVDCIG